MSDSVRPHGLQPTRLLRPWDFPSKSTGGGLTLIKQHQIWCKFSPPSAQPLLPRPSLALDSPPLLSIRTLPRLSTSNFFFETVVCLLEVGAFYLFCRMFLPLRKCLSTLSCLKCFWNEAGSKPHPSLYFSAELPWHSLMAPKWLPLTLPVNARQEKSLGTTNSEEWGGFATYCDSRETYFQMVKYEKKVTSFTLRETECW